MIKITKESLTKETLIKIKKIDDLFYNDIKIEWYLARYHNFNYGYLVYDEDKFVGYLIAVPITKALWQALTSGVLINDYDINPKMFIKNSKYYYIVSCNIKPNYRKSGLGSKLMTTLLSENKGRFVALTITEDGFKLANKYMILKSSLNSMVNILTLNN